EEAATAVALMMRESLEQRGSDGRPITCALVTPDLQLSRRVEARLARWGIVPDSSTGQPLSRMTAGVLVDLCARFLAEPLKPQTLLAVLKHPLVRLDLGETTLTDAAEALGERAPRGPRSRGGSQLHERLLKAARLRRGGLPLAEWKLVRLKGAQAPAARLEALATARPCAPDEAART